MHSATSTVLTLITAGLVAFTGTAGGTQMAAGGNARAAASTVNVDDAVTGTGNAQFEYSPGWDHCGPCASDGEVTPLYDKSNSWSSTSGSTATFRFTGTSVKLYGVKHSKAGIASVSIDGGSGTRVDMYSAARKGNQLFFERSGLRKAEHKIVVTVTGDHNPASSGAVINLDRVGYVGDKPKTSTDSPYDQLLPKPVSVSETKGAAFNLTASSRIVVSGRTADQGTYLREVLRPATGFKLPVAHGHPRRGDIALDVRRGGSPTGHDREGYKLTVGNRVKIVATKSAGVVNGIATLRQLLPVWIDSKRPVAAKWAIPAGNVEDYPRFAYRGTMIDLSRNYMSPNQLKTQIDKLARLKIDQLHLHLTDDPSWRIAISQPPHAHSTINYGRLMDIGSHGGVITGYSAHDPHPGHYTQRQYRSLVRYAATRNIDIIPEIDGPAHSTAATASIPQLNASGKTAPIFIPTNGQRTYFDPNLPATKKFLSTVFTQLAEMTPGKYLNFGGDEAANMSKADYDKYVSMVKSIIAKTGKTPIGWNETADQASAGDVVQYWTGNLGATEAAAARGAKVIMSPAKNTYFDQIYAPGIPADGATWACPSGCSAKTAYNWNPVQGSLKESDVLGVEGATWGDPPDQIDFLYFPRIMATAEVGWTPQADRNYTDFSHRVGEAGPRLDLSDTNFYADPNIAWKPAISAVPSCTAGTFKNSLIAVASAPTITPKQAIVMVDYGDGTPKTPALVTAAHSASNSRSHGLFKVYGDHHYTRPGVHHGSLTFNVGSFTKTIKEPFTVRVGHCRR